MDLFQNLLICFVLCLALRTPAQEITTMNLPELKQYIYSGEDVTYVVNFWATWCAPCVKELPYFEAFNKKKYKENVRVLLVSLDFDDALESRLIPFVKKYRLESEVIHFLPGRSPNYWIPEFSNQWTGSIPATLILNGKRGVNAFYERPFDSYRDLNQTFEQLFK